MRITDEEFIVAWQSTKDREDVPSKTKSASYHLASCRARYMRSNGVPLKKFPRPARSKWDSLIKLAQKHLKPAD